MVVVIFETSGREPALPPESLERLAELGVSSVALLRDEATAGLVLEGWAFDPVRARDAVLDTLGAGADARTLLPLAQMAVTAARSGEV
ncbi:MAG TPA: hypothetical protein VFU99_12850 [Gaiellaceae bacterium]|nr:hypothetical protein [Gaiellaceae bacterium]